MSLEDLKRREMGQVIKILELEMRGLTENGSRFEKAFFDNLRQYVTTQEGHLQPLLVVLGYRSLSEDNSQDVHTVAASFLLVHSYYHIQDDVVDEDVERRGLPTFWKRMEEFLKPFGLTRKDFIKSVGFIGGNVSRALAVSLLQKADITDSSRKRILELLTDLDLSANMGEYLELVQTSLNPRTLHEDFILKTYRYLTRYWVYGALAVGGILAGKPKDFFEDFGVPLGIALQLRNDLEDINRGSDLREGRTTLLVWYAVNHGSDRDVKVLEDLLGREDVTKKDVERYGEILRRTGAVDYVEEKIRELVEEARAALYRLDIKEDYVEAFEDLISLTLGH